MLNTFCRKQISVVILKPNNEVTSPTRYLYQIFLLYDCSGHAYMYAGIYDFSYVRQFCE